MEDLNIYNVIWVDDEIDELLSPVEIKRLLRNHGIHIEPAHNSTEFLPLCIKSRCITDTGYKQLVC